MVWPLQSAVSALQNIVQAIRAAVAAVAGAPALLWAALAEQPATFSSTITLDFSLGFNFSILLTGNTVLENPINAKVGQAGIIYLTQDATGSRLMTFGTAWFWPMSIAPVLDTTPNAIDVIFYKVRSPTAIFSVFVDGWGPSGGVPIQYPFGTPGPTILMEAEADEPMIIPGIAGAAGAAGPAGATGAQGPLGPPVYLEASEADEPFPGPPGAVGSAGTPGAIGAQGPSGPPIYLEAPEADEALPGPPGAIGPSGSTGSIGPQGAAGPQGATAFLEGPEADEPIVIPGPAGLQGAVGSAGTTGAQGPLGPAVYLEAPEADESIMQPGPQGIQGIQGTTGATGPVGPVFQPDTPEVDEPFVHVGAQGIAGPTGAQGPLGPAVYLEAPEADEPIIHPGPQGAQGVTGSTGNTGAQGPIGPVFQPDTPEVDEPFVHVGAQGIAGPTGAQGPLGPAVYLEAAEADEPITLQAPTSVTLGLVNVPRLSTYNIAAQTGFTGGGASNYAAPPCNASQVYRLVTIGNYVAVSSGTARSAEMTPTWGSNTLGVVTIVIPISTAQTTNFRAEFFLYCSSTTTIWVTGTVHSAMGSSTGVYGMTRLVPVSATVATGPQTLYMAFAMTVAVTGDQWNLDQIIIERLQ